MTKNTSSLDRDGLYDRAHMERAILKAIRDAMAGQVIPALKHENDALTGQLILRLLDFLQEQDRGVAPSLSGRDGLPEALTRQLSVLASVPPINSHDLVGIANALSAITASGLEGEKARFLERLSVHEESILTALDFHSGVADTYAKGVVSMDAPAEAGAHQSSLNEENLTRAVVQSGCFGAGARAHSIVEIPGGFNKLTASFKVSHDGGEESLILRRDSAPNPTGFTCIDEFPTLQAVWREGNVPVAEAIFAEPDAAVLGAPFIVVRKMRGTTDISQWRDNPAAGRALAKTLAIALAKLHALDVRRFLPEGASVQPLALYVAAEIDRWRQKSLRWRIRPSPALDAGFAWAAASVPKAARAPVLVHGDVGFHNMLMDNGQLIALLDWEFSHIGDPLEDILYCKPFVSAVCPFEEFLAMYAAAGGVAFDPSVVDFYELWPSLRNGSGCDALMRVFLDHPGSDLKFAVAGVQHVRRYENAVLAHLAKVARGLPES